MKPRAVKTLILIKTSFKNEAFNLQHIHIAIGILEKHNAFQWFQTQMLKNIVLQWFQARMLKNRMLYNDVKLKGWNTQCFSFNDFKLKRLERTKFFPDVKFKCWKTECFSMISSSNVEEHNVFQWFQAQVLKTIMLFHDFESICWTTQCSSMISS